MKNTKKIISLLLSVLMIITSVPLMAVESFAADEITSGVTGDCTWSLDSDGVLTISGNGKMKDYSFNERKPWGTSITKVVIENGVTSIGNWAFENCFSLTSITILDGVRYIGNCAFLCCDSLTSVTIPDGVTSIGDKAFYGCTSLTSVTIPDSVTSIGEAAFESCRSLTSVTIGNGVTSIGEAAFESCRSLTSITIPDSVTSIGHSAFRDCTSLTSIVIPDSVTSIGLSAFEDCTSLTSITIPNSVTSVGNRAFYNCTSLTSITIPDSVTSIGNSAFQNCTALKSVTIGNGVTRIGQSAFYDCTSLISITIPNSVTSVGNQAFYNCTWLTSVTIGNGVKSIGYSAFYNCSWLTSVTIPNSVTRIGKKAFGYYHDERIHGFTIYGNKGSEAERYANKNGFKFAQAAPAPTMTFPDVRSGDWYYDAVKFNFERGYITGYSNGTFGPANNIQRQDFVLILARIAGADLSAYEGQNGGFSDVPTDAYYSSAVAWAKDKGVVNGYSSDYFGVGTYISREQICLIFSRYLGGEATGDVDAIVQAYRDGGNTSPWAKAGVAWAIENGIVGNAGYINPIGNAGRAEVAQIIYNMANKGMI